MTQSDEIACRIFGNENSLFLEESIMSCFPVSSDICFCTVGGDNPAVARMRANKRQIPTMFYDTMEEAILDSSRSGSWTMLLNAGEVLHEDSTHFIWDFVKNHGHAYDCMYMPIYNCCTGELEEEMRVLSPRAISLLRLGRAGVFFPSVEVCGPSGLFPKPTISVYDGYVIPDGAPSVLRRFEGRAMHTDQYVV